MYDGLLEDARVTSILDYDLQVDRETGKEKEMSFLKVMIKQQSEGKPGFIDEDEFEVQIGADKITLFNKSDEEPGVVFVRLTCGATLCVVMKYATFVTKLKTALQNPGKITK